MHYCFIIKTALVKGLKVVYSSLWEIHGRATQRHQPWDHAVFCTCHSTRWTRSALTLAIQAGTRFTYSGRMKGWVDLGVGYMPRWFTRRQTVTHPGSNLLIATGPGDEPIGPQDRKSTKPPFRMFKSCCSDFIQCIEQWQWRCWWRLFSAVITWRTDASGFARVSRLSPVIGRRFHRILHKWQKYRLKS